MLRSATFEKLGKIMLVFSNYAKNYASTIYKSLVEGLSSGNPRVEEELSLTGAGLLREWFS